MFRNSAQSKIDFRDFLFVKIKNFAIFAATLGLTSAVGE